MGIFGSKIPLKTITKADLISNKKAKGLYFVLSPRLCELLLRRSSQSCHMRDINELKHFLSSEYNLSYKTKGHIRSENEMLKLHSKDESSIPLSCNAERHLSQLCAHLHQLNPRPKLIDKVIFPSLEKASLKNRIILRKQRHQYWLGHYDRLKSLILVLCGRIRLTPSALRTSTLALPSQKKLDRAHKLSLQLAVALYQIIYQRNHVTKKDIKELKNALNATDNIYLTCEYTNRVRHVKYDNEIIKALHLKTPKKLSFGAKQRVKQICNVLPKLPQDSDTMKDFSAKTLERLNKLLTMDPQQPRAPRDMQGLLKFCIEATKGEDAKSDPESTLAAMDPTRRQWLEQALSSMSVDVIKELAEGIKILNSPCVTNPEASEEEVEKVEYAFECISDWVDQIDMANNFHKIGGFDSLKLCLSSAHASLRSSSANAIAELSQNNPYCQERFVAEDFLPILLEMITNDSECKVKAMYAISCIIRECQGAQDKFLNELNGPSVILNATMTSTTPNDKLRIKACFFISSLCEENQKAKEAFVDMGLARQILTLMQMEEHSQSHEHMARALLLVLKDNKTVKDELVNSSELKLRDFLVSRIQLVQGQEEYEEELAYLKEIMEQCYGKSMPQSNSVDR